MNNIYKKILEYNKLGIKAILFTIVSDSGSTPRKSGAKMLVSDNLELTGTIGGGVLEKTLIDKIPEFIDKYKSELISYNLTKDLGMVCGGSVEVFVEPIFNKFKLLIFGAGHIGKALVKIIKDINFDITVFDNRQDIFNNWEEFEINKIFCDFSNLNNHSEFIIDNNTFIVIATSNHSFDVEILKQCINKNYFYIGLIGSKKKTLEIRKIFIQENLASEEELNKIDMPIGLDIKAEGPEEIAVSIAAKLILEKNNI